MKESETLKERKERIPHRAPLRFYYIIGVLPLFRLTGPCATTRSVTHLLLNTWHKRKPPSSKITPCLTTQNILPLRRGPTVNRSKVSLPFGRPVHRPSHPRGRGPRLSRHRTVCVTGSRLDGGLRQRTLSPIQFPKESFFRLNYHKNYDSLSWVWVFCGLFT